MAIYYCGECEREVELVEGEEPICPTDGSDLLRFPEGRKPGDVVAGRYTIEEPLGHGGMGIVFKARHQASGEPLALKLIRRDQDDETTVKRFFREARASTRISHPGVVQAYDFGQTSEGVPYMAMELLEGIPLKEILEREGALDPTRAAHLGAEIASALAATHTLDILHRDLKPSNVMVRREEDAERVKLLDFGLAKAAGGGSEELRTVTSTGTPVGTPNYMSPEQFRCQELEPETDLYGLGCLLYHMLSGRPPYRGDNLFSLMRQHVESQPPSFDDAVPGHDIPDRLAELCRTLLEKDVADRPGDAAAVAESLDAVADPSVCVEVPREAEDVVVDSDSDTLGGGETIQAPPGAAARMGRRVFRPDLVGRSGTREFLENVLEQCIDDDRPALVAMEGPAGVGKSTLVEWIRGRAAQRAERVALGRHEEGHPGPFGALKEALESLVGLEGVPDDEIEAELESFFSDADLDDGHSSAGLTSAERRRLRSFLRPETDEDTHRQLEEEGRTVLYEAIVRALRASAAASPTVVLLDDLRDSDPFDAAFVERLGDRLAGEEIPLLVLTATRTELSAEDDPEVGGDMMETMEQVASSLAVMLRDRFYRIEVGPLEEEDGERLLRRAVPGITSEAVERIVDFAGGNPLHTLQLVRHLVAEGSLRPDGREWVLKGELTIPEDLDAVLEARLEDLRDREDERDLLIRAALVGERVPLEVLETVLERENDFEILDELDLLLDRLIDGGWLRDEASWEEEAVVFEHGYVRRALVERYGSRRAARSVRHAVAEALEAYHADDLEPVASQIADHFIACREYGRALPYLERAARAAERRYAIDEAVDTWERALEVTAGRGAPDWDADAARRELVRLLIHAGRYDEADDHLDELGDHAATLELRGDLADARAEYENAVEFFDRAKNNFGDSDRESATEVSIKLAIALTKISAYGEAKSLLVSAREYADNSDKRRLEARALNQLAMISQLQGELGRAVDLVDSEETIWRRLNESVSLARSLYRRGSIHWRRGEFEEALEAYGESIPLLERAGHRRGLVHSLRMAGATAQKLDRLDEALAYCERALQIAENLQDERALLGVAVCLADVHRGRAELDAAKKWATTAMELAEKLGSPHDRHSAFMTLGEVNVKAEESERAISNLRKALAISDDMGEGPNDRRAHIYETLADAKRQTGNESDAQNDYRSSIEIYREIGNSNAAREVHEKLEELRSQMDGGV